MSLVSTEFVRKPFVVKVIEVTIDNMEELNEKYKLGTLEKKDDGTPYLALPARKGGSTFRVFAGYLVVDMGKNARCYSRKVFYQQFEAITPEWVAYFEHNPST